MVKYSYYPGNVARQSSQEVEDTIQPLARSLGIELIEMVGFNGDGGNIIKQGNRDLQLALNARNFALAELNGHDIITPCASAQGIMHESLSIFKNNAIALADANRVLEKTTGMTLNAEELQTKLFSKIIKHVKSKKKFNFKNFNLEITTNCKECS